MLKKKKYIEFDKFTSWEALDLTSVCALFNSDDFCQENPISVFIKNTKLQAIHLPLEEASLLEAVNFTNIFISDAAMNPLNEVVFVSDISGRVDFDLQMITILLAMVLALWGIIIGKGFLN